MFAYCLNNPVKNVDQTGYLAYCNNNPVCATDPYGELPQAIISLLDYYVIHKLVQMMIVLEYGYAMEVYVKDADGKRGFLDLYDYALNQYYEVKHDQYDAAATEAQMLRYDTSTIKSWMFEDFTIAGSPARGKNIAISGSFTYKDYSIEYSVAAPGLIHYKIASTGTKLHEFAYMPERVTRKKENTQSFLFGGYVFFFSGSMPLRYALGDDTSFDLGLT